MFNERNYEQEKLNYLKRISNNLSFFFWLTVASLTGGFLLVLMELQKVH